MSWPVTFSWPTVFSWPVNFSWPTSLSWPASFVVNPFVYGMATNEISAFSFPNRAAVLAGNRATGYLIMRNMDTLDMEVGSTTNANNNTNSPGSWTTVSSGQQATVTSDTNQWYYRPAATRVKTLTALTSVGTTATAVLVGHGLSSGNMTTLEGGVPKTYNQAQTVVTVIDANTFTYVLGATAGLVTTLPHFFDGSQRVQIEIKLSQP